jgi:hypothetical protein
MGQKVDFPYKSIERFRGDLSSTDNSTAPLDSTVSDSPHCGHEAALLCVPKEKFIADMPSQGLGSVHLPAWDQLDSEDKRPRSNSIPIKINRAVPDDSKGDEGCMCRYDLATWQMYNRIVIHRLNCPLNLSQKDAPGVSRQASDDATLHGSSCEMVGPMPIPGFHDYLEGEVVELELCSSEMVDPMPVPDSNHYLEDEVFEMDL